MVLWGHKSSALFLLTAHPQPFTVRSHLLDPYGCGVYYLFFYRWESESPQNKSFLRYMRIEGGIIQSLMRRSLISTPGSSNIQVIPCTRDCSLDRLTGEKWWNESMLWEGKKNVNNQMLSPFCHFPLQVVFPRARCGNVTSGPQPNVFYRLSLRKIFWTFCYVYIIQMFN